jgi:hypothetical protein
VNHVRFLRAALGSAAVSVRCSPAACLPHTHLVCCAHHPTLCPHLPALEPVAALHVCALSCPDAVSAPVRLQMPRINIGSSFAAAANAAFNTTLPAPFNPCASCKFNPDSSFHRI